MTGEPAATYQPGATFTCTRLVCGWPCGAVIRMHRRPALAQICPVCIACYGRAPDGKLYPSRGWFDPTTTLRLRAAIAAVGGQYRPYRMRPRRRRAVSAT
jgi:hypothetical protein